MGEPSRDSGDGEENREEVSGESHCLVDDARVEVNVGVELSIDEVFVTSSNLLKLHCDFDQWLLAYYFEDLLSELSAERSSRIVVLVYSMTKPEEKSLLLLHVLHELGHILNSANLLKHLKDSFIGSSMLGPVKGSCSSGDASEDICSSAGEVSDS